MDKEVEVFEIDVNKKYILLISGPIPAAEAHHAQEVIDRWIKSNRAILVVSDNCRLVKVED